MKLLHDSSLLNQCDDHCIIKGFSTHFLKFYCSTVNYSSLLSMAQYNWGVGASVLRDWFATQYTSSVIWSFGFWRIKQWLINWRHNMVITAQSHSGYLTKLKPQNISAPSVSKTADTVSKPPVWRSHISPLLASYLVPLHLQPKEHIILQKVSFQSHKVLELQTSDGVEEAPSKEQGLLGRSHPWAPVLQWNSERKCSSC